MSTSLPGPLPGPTERFPGRDGDLCEVCKNRVKEMHLKHVFIGHKDCLERNDLDIRVIGQNIIDNTNTYEAEAAA